MSGSRVGLGPEYHPFAEGWLEHLYIWWLRWLVGESARKRAELPGLLEQRHSQLLYQLLRRCPETQMVVPPMVVPPDC